MTVSERSERMSDESEQPRGAGASRPRRKAIRRAGPPEGDAPAPVVHTEPAPPAAEAPEPADAKPVVLGKTTAAAAPEAKTPEVKTPEVKTAAAQASRAKRQWLIPIVAAVAAAVLVVLAIGVGFLTIANNRTSDRADEQAALRDSYVEAAKTTVLNLTTIHADSAKADVDKILDNASGEFLDEFQGRIEPFVSIVRDAQVDTDGEVLAAGVESEADGEVVVLVAAKTMVRNAGTDEPQPRNFRMRITITDVDGRLTTSKVEFVP